MLFTTSWDDGYALDNRLVALLARYGVTGTLYPCPRPQGNQRMLSDTELRALSAHMEIGAHTITHPRLGTIPLQDAEREIRESKRWVEERSGKPCTMFCYPKGHWNPAVRDLVERAGYRGARTTAMVEFRTGDPYAMPTSLHVYPFPLRVRWVRAAHVWNPLPWLRQHKARLKELGVPVSAKLSWIRFARWLFAYALSTRQPHFHLWGHSPEVAKHGMWGDLEEFLGLVRSAGAEVRHVRNSDLLQP